jgi:uncharacterized protein
MRKQDALSRFDTCKAELRDQFGLKALWLFGSVARDEALTDSDVDVLVEFEGTASFDRFMDLKFRLEDLLGRRVDLVTTKALKPRLRPFVDRELVRVA